jgi:molybdopterin converting factor subunit 1
MRVRLRFFASLRERLRTSEADVEVADGATVRQIWDGLCAEHAGLERFSASVSFAVNREYADGDARVRDGDEIAFIPPVSGG